MQNKQMKTNSFGVDQVCHIKHLDETRILLRALASVGFTGRYVGAGFSKISVLGIGCGRTDDDMWGHLSGKILYHVWILIYLGGFISSICNLSDVVGIITFINFVYGGINISIILSWWRGWAQKTEGRASWWVGISFIVTRSGSIE